MSVAYPYQIPKCKKTIDMVKISFRTALHCVVNLESFKVFKCFVVVDDMLFCTVTFNLWLHYNKLLTYLLIVHST